MRYFQPVIDNVREDGYCDFSCVVWRRAAIQRVLPFPHTITIDGVVFGYNPDWRIAYTETTFLIPRSRYFSGRIPHSNAVRMCEILEKMNVRLTAMCRPQKTIKSIVEKMNLKTS